MKKLIKFVPTSCRCLYRQALSFSFFCCCTINTTISVELFILAMLKITFGLFLAQKGTKKRSTQVYMRTRRINIFSKLGD